MDGILAWGLDVVRAAQALFGPGAAPAMKAISFIGSEMFALVMLPFLYWCVDRRRGMRIGLAVLFSAFTNLWFKYRFMQPRPYDLEPALGLARETTPGLPSGHSQTSITFWGALASLFPRGLGLALAILIPLVVGISRIYLGVHFPTDVFAGWALGAIILVAFGVVGPKFEALLHGFNLRYRLVTAAAVALLMNFLLPGDSSIAGVFLGAGLGFGLGTKHARFDANGTLREKALRYLIGIAGTLALYLVPKLLLGAAGLDHDRLARFLRYAVVGGWVAFGAPWIFLRLRLAAAEPLPDVLRNASGA